MALTYIIQKATELDGPYSDVVTGLTATDYVVTGQPTNTHYYIRIKKDDSGNISYSNVRLVVMLDAPVLSGEGGESGFIRLSWEDTCAENYYVYKYNYLNNTYMYFGETSELEFLDYNVGPGINYYYYVTGVTPELFESDPSNVINAYVTEEDIFAMGTRATLYQATQLGLETTPGTAVATNRRVRALEIKISPKIPSKPIYTVGQKAAIGVQKGKQMSPGSYTGPLDFKAICYPLLSMFGSPTETTPATGAFQRIWNPSPQEKITPKTFTLEHGSAVGAEKYPFVIFNSLSIKGDDNSAEISGNLFGAAVTRDITVTAEQTITLPTASLGATSIAVTTSTAVAVAAGTYISRAGKIVTVVSGGTAATSQTLTVSALAAALTAGDVIDKIYRVEGAPADPVSIGIYYSTDNSTWTLLTDPLSWDVNFSGLFEHVFHVRDDTTSYDDVVEKLPDFSMSLSFDANGSSSEESTFYGYVTNKTKIYIGFNVQGALITGSTYEQIQFRFPCYVTDPTLEDEGGVYSGKFNLVAAMDEVYGMAYIKVVNTLPLTF